MANYRKTGGSAALRTEKINRVLLHGRFLWLADIGYVQEQQDCGANYDVYKTGIEEDRLDSFGIDGRIGHCSRRVCGAVSDTGGAVSANGHADRYKTRGY